MLNTLKEMLKKSSFKKVLENIEDGVHSTMQDAAESELNTESLPAAEVDELIKKIPCSESGDDPVDVQGLIDSLPVPARV